MVPASRESLSLAQFIVASSGQIIGEWEEFARTGVPAMNLEQRRDHLAGMLKAIALDLETPQTQGDQELKSKGHSDAAGGNHTAASAHGVDRAQIGYTPVQMVSEFRALRASVLRLWAAAGPELSPGSLEEVTRFNEAIDQLLAVSTASYSENVERSKDLLLGVLGHDLRNPLGAIMLTATSMMHKAAADASHNRDATRIVTSCKRMDAMIRDLVDFTRTRLGSGIPVDVEDMDLERVCREIVDEHSAQHPRGVAQLEASGSLHGRWDRGRIGQLLSNLLGNASQHGTPNCPVTVVLRGVADQVVITVHNQGPMIAASDLEEIFSPFRQLDAERSGSRDPRSAGLGLYIVQAIVTAHQGTIEVASNQRGTTFTVTLPRQVATT